MNKVTSINSNIRKFHTTRCEVCGGIDGIVEQLKSYNSKRDLDEWIREGRTVSEYVQKGKEKIPFCVCPFESEETFTSNS